MGEKQNPWAYYYLRYFVGAVVGAGLLMAVLQEAYSNKVLPAMLPEGSPKDWVSNASVVTALGTAGLAYCYVASAPVLILHSFRARFPHNLSCWNVLGSVIAVVTVAFGLALCFRGDIPGRSLRPAGYWPFLAVMLLQLYFVAWPRVGAVRIFYNELAGRRARSKEEQTISEYVESFRHLREHGNAFLIILMEIVLAFALYAADTRVRFFGLVVVWIMPAAFIWPLGTWLEREFPQQKP